MQIRQRCGNRVPDQKRHKKIGYLRGDFRIQAFRSRALGYARALHNHGLEADSQYTFTLATTMDGVYKLIEILKQARRFLTAFFADNDMIALGAMEGITGERLQNSEDISIVGFDDLPFCEIASPRLTTIRVSKPEMGAAAVRRMHELIEHVGSETEKISICTDFIERDSVRDIRNI